MAARCDALPKCVAPDRLAARLHALSGARIAAVDLSPDRVALSKEAGVEAYVVKKSLAATFASVLPQALAAAKEKPWDDTAGLGARVVIQDSYTESFSIPYALAAGDTTDMILEDYPNLQREDIAAALAFASDLQNLYRLPFRN